MIQMDLGLFYSCLLLINIAVITCKETIAGYDALIEINNTERTSRWNEKQSQEINHGNVSHNAFTNQTRNSPEYEAFGEGRDGQYYSAYKEEVESGILDEHSIVVDLMQSSAQSIPDYLNAAPWLYERNKRLHESMRPVAQSCLQDILAYRRAVKALQLTALDMYLSQGSFTDFSGIADECIMKDVQLEEHYEDKQEKQAPNRTFNAQFCFADFKDVPMVGLCVPDSCSSQDIARILQTGYASSFLGQVLCEESLYLKQDDRYHTMVRAIIAILTINLCCTVISQRQVLFQLVSLHKLGYITRVFKASLCRCCFALIEKSCAKNREIATDLNGKNGHKQEDNYNIYKSHDSQNAVEPVSFLCRVINCFNINQNVRSLVSTHVPADSIQCLPAFRVISMTMVVFYHTYYYTQTLVVSSRKSWYDFSQSSLGELVAMTNVTVEAFFVISALLAVSQCVSMLEKSPQVRIIPFVFSCYLKRLWRLIPVFYLVFFIQAYLLPYLSKIPRYGSSMQQMCQDSYLSHLTFTYNLQIIKEGFANLHCVPQSWYVCADMQLFLLIPWLAVIYNKSHKRSFILAALLPILVFMTVTAIGYYKHTNTWNATWTMYALPQHANSYMAGILLGLVYAKTKFHFKLHKVVTLLLCACSVICIYIMYNSNDDRVELVSSFTEIIFASNWRSCYGFLTAICILFCCQYDKNTLSSVLNSPCWLPLSRLSYSVFLVSCVLQKSYYSKKDTWPKYWEPLDMVFDCGGFLTLSVLASTVVWVLVEKPCDNLIKAVTKKQQSTETLPHRITHTL